MPPTTIREGMGTGERIAAWRIYRGVTQESCAGLVGKSLSWWKKVEQGVRHVEKLSDLILIAQVLKVRTLEDLTGVLEFSLALDRTREHPLLQAVRAAMVTAVDPLGPDPSDPAEHDLDISARLASVRRTFHASRHSIAATGELLPRLITDAARALRAAEDLPSRRAAAVNLSDVYVLACQWCRHVAAVDLAHTAADRALTHAQESGWVVGVGLASWQMGGTLKDLGRAEEALELCQNAGTLLARGLDEAADEHLAVWGQLQFQAALSAAHTVDEGTALRLWDAGEQASRRVSRGYVHPVCLFDQSGMQAGMFAVHLNVALGKSRPALQASERVDWSVIPSAPIRARGIVDIARGYAARRDDVATLHVLQRAEQEHYDTTAHNVYVREITREMLRRDRRIISHELHEFARAIGVFA